VWSSD